MTSADTGWVDRSEYPFAQHFMEFDEGQMCYVDEGQGPPVVMVHGTPTWSFLYRHWIKQLSPRYRCLAPDHLGFGLSDKPANGRYRPEDHARRLHAFIERLNLRDIVLVVHDFGGPVGLSYALDHPENVRALVLCNTWMWSLEEQASLERASRIMGGRIGKFLYTRLNFSPRVLLRAAWGERATLTPEIHRHYTDIFPRPTDRQAPWVLARELIGSSAWFDGLWQRRDRIAAKPALVLWGMKDPTFGVSQLDRWRTTFTDARVVELPAVGHFVPDESRDTAATVASFLADVVSDRLENTEAFASTTD